MVLEENILKTDKEIYEALLQGEKITKISSTKVDFVHLENGYLVDHEGKPSVIYRITHSDNYKIVSHLYKDNRNDD